MLIVPNAKLCVLDRMRSEVRWIRVVLLSPEPHRTTVYIKSHCKEQRAYIDEIADSSQWSVVLFGCCSQSGA